MSKIKCVYFEVSDLVQVRLRTLDRRHETSAERIYRVEPKQKDQSSVVSYYSIPEVAPISEYPVLDADEKDIERLVAYKPLFKNQETGELLTHEDMPVGAMWYLPHYERYPHFCGPDGKSLVVRVPGNYDWMVDMRCSNCTRREDNSHRCWIRHGTPPNIHVDKNGNTCSAGAGSIVAPGWHGFLTHGYLQLER